MNIFDGSIKFLSSFFATNRIVRREFFWSRYSLHFFTNIGLYFTNKLFKKFRFTSSKISWSFQKMANPFENFPQYYENVYGQQTPDNEKILEATKILKDFEVIPGYVEYLIQLLVSTSNLQFQMFIAVSIKNQVKVYWENEQFYANKPEIKARLITIMLNSTPPLLSSIAEIISIIASFDFPDKWPELMPALTGSFTNASFQVIYSILFTSHHVFKRYERQTSSEPLFREISQVVDYWGPVVLKLLTETLHQQPSCPELAQCFEYTLSICFSLCAQDLPPFFLNNLDKFFMCYHNFLTMNFTSGIKKIICQIIKQHIIRYITDIHKWGTDEENKRSEEEIDQMKQLYATLLNDLLTLTTMETAANDESLVISIFDTLTALARSMDRQFFTIAGNLEKMCQDVLIPCIALSEEDIELFQNDPLEYFKRDIEGLQSESRKMSAYSFLKVLGRYFRAELTSVFMGTYQTLMAKYSQNPEASWKEMDTAIFIMEIIGAKINLVNIGVTELVENFDLSSFLGSCIIPLLGSSFPILQADAIKFMVDFRNVTQQEIIFNVFPTIVNLLFVENSLVPLYSAYYIDRILLCKQCETNTFIFQNVDLKGIINRLFYIFKFADQFNLIAARSLMRIVVRCGAAIAPQIGGIVSTCVNYLTQIASNSNLQVDPAFNHCLFEVIVGAITKVNVPVVQIEGLVFELLSSILSHDVSAFIPYVFQIVACFLLSYPENVQINNFYAEQFEFFLNPTHWMAGGNIPALAILMRAYIIKLPQLVIVHMDQLFFICKQLLQGTRSHPHAFLIFVSLFRFMQNEFCVQILPQIYALVTEQIGNPNLKKYRQTFSIFMADACYFLGPDVALSLLPSQAEVIGIWAESLPLVRGRVPLESTISGCMTALLGATCLTQELWETLFVGTVKMLEAPSAEIINDEIDLIKQEEQDAKQFDTIFSELKFAEIPQINNAHPELANVNLVEFMARKLAEYSAAHPNYLRDVIARRLPPYLQNSFNSYEHNYQIRFM
ncbi:hypothetical protein TRFO_33923 [Tritrichomonas foetus]|uniref:Importin N-terminal domain-containing protein n=1 Tax=Tritrichomonas foetus TaxID=1144522 RepID=A0A1J4JPZ6_9EUKA|nr:hypothetical protein TRFO_33923 [Tritrichomonas foetus]|eukprot:OHS99595.1 hypothetical protein TRFO_33923 [Tritrichomonas foetus]